MTESIPTHQRLLKLLKEKEGAYLSGSAVASELGLSRVAVWKSIRSLKSLGYDIQSHPKEGYRLVGIPDLLIPEEVLPNLKSSWLGRSYHYYPTIGSTNDQALLLAAQGAPHGTVVLSEEQTKGKGRLKREWVSPAKRGIYHSLLLRSPIPVHQASHPTHVVALTLAKLFKTAYGLASSIKWPNDVLIAGKKVVGILAEVQSDQDLTTFLVIGIGINVNQTKEEMAGPFRYPATSVAIELGRAVRRQNMLTAFLESFETEFERFLREGFGVFIPQIEEYSALLGRRITILRGEEEFTGKALRFTPEGALVLLKADGREEAFWAGDVARVEGAS